MPLLWENSMVRASKLSLCSWLGNVMVGTYPTEAIQQHHPALGPGLLNVAHLQQPKRQFLPSTADGQFKTVCHTTEMAYSSYGVTQKPDIWGGSYAHMLLSLENHGCVHVQGSGKQQQQLRLLSSCKVLGPVGTQQYFTAPTVFLNNIVSQVRE